MFRTDSDLLSDVLAVLPLEEMEKEFSGKEVSVPQFLVFLSRKGLLGKICKVLKEDGTDASIIDIARAIKFYKGIYKEIMQIISE
jgi:hypothetical protein